MAQILQPKLDLDAFLTEVAHSAKQLRPDVLEARVYEVNFIENRLYLKTSTHVDVAGLLQSERTFTILPQTITGDAVIENRVIYASRFEGYRHSRFVEGEDMRAAFPIEFHDVESPEGRTKYVLVVDKEGPDPIPDDIMAALMDFSILAGLAISIKELRDTLSQYYEENRNLVLTGRHSASIAHDIRSLNVGIGGYLTLALKHLESDSAQKKLMTQKYLSYAQDSARQVESLLKDFAEFNRRAIVLNRDADLADAVLHKIELLSSRIDFGRLVQFQVDIPKGKTGVMVDRDWFGTVVENLVKNSVEACADRALIKVDLQTSETEIVLTFEDNCGGIPSDLLPELFTPFRTSKRRGLGLGLTNAKKVVQDHGGEITVDNGGDQGARFILTFPKEDGLDSRA
jgi:signal transduction histidine kinase